MTMRYQDQLVLDIHSTSARGTGGDRARRRLRLLAAAVTVVATGLLLHEPGQARPADDQVLLWGDGRAPRLVSSAVERAPEAPAGGHVLVWGDGEPPRLVAR